MHLIGAINVLQTAVKQGNNSFHHVNNGLISHLVGKQIFTAVGQIAVINSVLQQLTPFISPFKPSPKIMLSKQQLIAVWQACKLVQHLYSMHLYSPASSMLYYQINQFIGQIIKMV